MSKTSLSTRKLTRLALLAAAAVVLGYTEGLLVAFMPLPPGIKLGLANIVTVYAMFALGPRDTLLILVSRVFLGSLFAGGSTFLYSLAGGLLCYAAMLVMRKFLTVKQLWVCGAIGSIFHNLGQMAVAVWIAKTVGLVMYLPFMIIPGIIAGVFTGLAAQFLLARVGERLKLDI